MNLNTLLQIGDNLNENSTLADRAYVGLQVVLIGMGVVFAVLVLLIGILQLFKLFANKQPKESVKQEPVVSAPKSTPIAAPVSSQPASEEELVVAIATAAIAAQRGESECNFNVISIKKIVK